MLPSWKSLAAAAAKTTSMQPAQGLPAVILLFLLAGLRYKSCPQKNEPGVQSALLVKDLRGQPNRAGSPATGSVGTATGLLIQCDPSQHHLL